MESTDCSKYRVLFEKGTVKARKLKFRHKHIEATDKRTGKLQFQQKHLRCKKRDDKRSAYQI